MVDKRMQVAKDVWTLTKTGVVLKDPGISFNKELRDSLTPEREFKPESRMGSMSFRDYQKLRESVASLMSYWEGRDALTEVCQARSLLGAVSMSIKDANGFELIRDYVVDANNSGAQRELKRECDVERMLFVVDGVREALPIRKNVRNPFFMPQLKAFDHVAHDAAERLSFELWSHHIRQSPQRLIGTLLFMPDHGQSLLEVIQTVAPLYSTEKLEEWREWETLAYWGC